MATVQRRILTDYLEGLAGDRWAWGSRDCALAVADYVLAATGRDPGTPFRGRYQTRLGCERLVTRYGGLVAVMAAGAALAALQRTDAPKEGDIGVAPMPVMRRNRVAQEPTAGFCLGRQWAFFTPGGLIFMNSTPLAAWVV